MNKECAIIIISACVKSTRDLKDVIALIDVEDQDIKLSLSSSIYDIMQNIIIPLQELYPDLKNEMDKRMEKYGRAF